MALQAQDDKKREEREKFLITTIPITIQAAHEPSLHHVGEEHEQEGMNIVNNTRNYLHRFYINMCANNKQMFLLNIFVI